ncbi:unnamed protein product [Chrysodeixis includens]|uniref:Uncharacterized protein n=1 Tax=Chrysodeixis includens TaxID=689277 RepID=A0A9P0C3T2_CHRIL|nr:unnamed protein product [Chrysodeixis includens]
MWTYCVCLIIVIINSKAENCTVPLKLFINSVKLEPVVSKTHPHLDGETNYEYLDGQLIHVRWEISCGVFNFQYYNPDLVADSEEIEGKSCNHAEFRSLFDASENNSYILYFYNSRKGLKLSYRINFIRRTQYSDYIHDFALSTNGLKLVPQFENVGDTTDFKFFYGYTKNEMINITFEKNIEYGILICNLNGVDLIAESNPSRKLSLSAVFKIHNDTQFRCKYVLDDKTITADLLLMRTFFGYITKPDKKLNIRYEYTVNQHTASMTYLYTANESLNFIDGEYIKTYGFRVGCDFHHPFLDLFDWRLHKNNEDQICFLKTEECKLGFIRIVFKMKPKKYNTTTSTSPTCGSRITTAESIVMGGVLSVPVLLTSCVVYLHLKTKKKEKEAQEQYDSSVNSASENKYETIDYTSCKLPQPLYVNLTRM